MYFRLKCRKAAIPNAKAGHQKVMMFLFSLQGIQKFTEPLEQCPETLYTKCAILALKQKIKVAILAPNCYLKLS